MDAADLLCPGHRPSGFLPGVKQTFAVHRGQAQSVAYGQVLGADPQPTGPRSTWAVSFFGRTVGGGGSAQRAALWHGHLSFLVV